MTTPHLIERLAFEIEIDPPDAELQEDGYLARLLQDTLLPVVDEVLDAWDEPGTVLTLPSLALDLGTIERSALREQAPARLRALLEEALAAARYRARSTLTHLVAPEAVDAPSARSLHEDALAQLAAYLASGRMPWHRDQARGDLHVALLDGLLRGAREALLRMLAQAGAQPGALRRLAEQFPAHQLARIVKAAAPGHAAALLAMQAGEECWESILGVALSRSNLALGLAALGRAPVLAPARDDAGTASTCVEPVLAWLHRGERDAVQAAVLARLLHGANSDADGQALAALAQGIAALLAARDGPRRLVAALPVGLRELLLQALAPACAQRMLNLVSEIERSLVAAVADRDVAARVHARCWEEVLAAGLQRWRLAPPTGVVRATLQVLAADAAGAVLHSGDVDHAALSRLAIFLDSGRLPGRREGREAGAHIALLDRLLARAGQSPALRKALWRLLSDAVADRASSLRLVRQFPVHQLSAIVRLLAPAGLPQGAAHPSHAASPHNEAQWQSGLRSAFDASRHVVDTRVAAQRWVPSAYPARSSRQIPATTASGAEESRLLGEAPADDRRYSSLRKPDGRFQWRPVVAAIGHAWSGSAVMHAPVQGIAATVLSPDDGFLSDLFRLHAYLERGRTGSSANDGERDGHIDLLDRLLARAARVPSMRGELLRMLAAACGGPHALRQLSDVFPQRQHAAILRLAASGAGTGFLDLYAQGYAAGRSSSDSTAVPPGRILNLGAFKDRRAVPGILHSGRPRMRARSQALRRVTSQSAQRLAAILYSAQRDHRLDISVPSGRSNTMTAPALPYAGPPIRDDLTLLRRFLERGAVGRDTRTGDYIDHIVLLDRLLDQASQAPSLLQALMRVLAMALSVPAALRRFTEQFAPRQLAAILRAAASGEVSAVLTRHGEIVRGNTPGESESSSVALAHWRTALADALSAHVTANGNSPAADLPATPVDGATPVGEHYRQPDARSRSRDGAGRGTTLHRRLLRLPAMPRVQRRLTTWSLSQLEAILSASVPEQISDVGVTSRRNLHVRSPLAPNRRASARSGMPVLRTRVDSRRSIAQMRLGEQNEQITAADILLGRRRKLTPTQLKSTSMVGEDFPVVYAETVGRTRKHSPAAATGSSPGSSALAQVSGGLARLAMFLATGRLAPMSNPDGHDGHIALLERLLDRASRLPGLRAQLLRTLATAIAGPMALRRLTGQFPQRQLASILFLAASKSDADLLSLFAEIQGAEALDAFARSDNEQAAWGSTLRQALDGGIEKRGAQARVAPSVTTSAIEPRTPQTLLDALSRTVAIPGSALRLVNTLPERLCESLIRLAVPSVADEVLVLLHAVRRRGNGMEQACMAHAIESFLAPEPVPLSVLHSRLEQLLQAAPTGSIAQTEAIQAPTQRAIDRLASFLRHASLSVKAVVGSHRDDVHAEVHVALLDKLLCGAAPLDALWRMLASLLEDPHVALRLVQQFPERQLRDIVVLAAPPHAEGLFALVADLHLEGGAAGIDPVHLRLALWPALLRAAVRCAAGLAAAPRLDEVRAHTAALLSELDPQAARTAVDADLARLHAIVAGGAYSHQARRAAHQLQAADALRQLLATEGDGQGATLQSLETPFGLARLVADECAAVAQAMDDIDPNPSLARIRRHLASDTRIGPGRRQALADALASAAVDSGRESAYLQLALQRLAGGEALDLEAMAAAVQEQGGAADTASNAGAARRAIALALRAGEGGQAPVEWRAFLAAKGHDIPRFWRLSARLPAIRAALEDGLPRWMFADLAAVAGEAATRLQSTPPATWPGSHPGAQQGERIAVPNAGMVLLAPWIARLFSMLGLVQEGVFVDLAAAERAVHLLQFAVSGVAGAPEYALTLNKLLCGLPLDAPVPPGIDLTEEERHTIEGLLESMIASWSALGRTSIDGLRQSFLMRGGELELAGELWQLAVDDGPFDMLMDRLPWSFSIVKFTWMPLPLHVSWH